MEHINGFKAAVAAVVGCLTALWGWFGWLVVAWVVCMLLDYGTGTAAALRAGEHQEQLAEDTLRDHALLMEFFQRGDAEGAEHAMAIHMRHAMDGMGLE